MAKTGIFYETQPGGGLTSDQALARDTLRELHPQSTEASDDDMLPVRDASGAVRRYSTSSKEYRDAFWEVFHSVPKARAMSVDGVSYEELEFLFYGGADPRQVLFDIVASINRGEAHESATRIWGDLQLLGIEKRDDDGNFVGTRPIGIPAAIRRLANRVLMKHRCTDMCNLLTGGSADARRVIRDGMREICLRSPEEGGLGMSAEEAAERAESCNVPLQVGVGLAGGAEVAIQLLREHLRRHPSHAIASDDKRNGFNCISRKAIFSGLRRWFPDLIPTVALWYSKRRRLFLFNDEARDGSGDIFDSAEGCAQGDPLGPFLFAIGYHWTLLEMQVRHPSTLICGIRPP